jgi:hypothetical protein
MAVRLLGIAKIFVEGFHGKSCQLSAVSFQLTIVGLFPSPADAVFGDFYQDAGGGEFGADRV